MFKFKKTVRFFSGGKEVVNLEDELDKVRKSLFQLIFALAMALKVSPSKLAKFFDEKKINEYAEKFHGALMKEDQKEQEKILKKLKKIKTQVK